MFSKKPLLNLKNRLLALFFPNIAPLHAWTSQDTLIGLRWTIAVVAPVLVLLSRESLYSVSLSFIIGFVFYTLWITWHIRHRGGLPRIVPLIDIVVVSILIYSRGAVRTDAYHFYYLAIISSGVAWGFLPSLVSAFAATVFYTITSLIAGAPTAFLGRIVIRAIYFVLFATLSGFLALMENRQRRLAKQHQLALEQLESAHEQLETYAEELSRMAITDGLTGLFNQMYFREHLEAILRQVSHTQTVSLVLIDIDHFKQYNDSFGHESGNELLQAIAGLLKENVRENDVVARYGGEEFAIILPNTSRRRAYVVAERIRKVVETLGREGTGGIPGGNITLSAGVAAYPADAATLEDFIRTTDQALYGAKEKGRNVVVRTQ